MIRSFDFDRGLNDSLDVALRDIVRGPSLTALRFAQLYRNPKRRQVRSHVAVKDSTTIVCDHKETVQDAEPEDWYRKEIHGRDGLAMAERSRLESHGLQAFDLPYIGFGKAISSKAETQHDASRQLSVVFLWALRARR